MRILLAFLLLLPPAHAAGVELRVQYTAIQKVLTRQMFTQDGRMYVNGVTQTKCSYAYIENPVVDASDGRIEIKALFSGRNATSIFGYCFGLGDSFVVRIVAAPYIQDGLIRLRDVTVDSLGKDTFYTRKVRGAISENLPKKFEYKVSDEAKLILERKRDDEPYSQRLQNFQVSQIQVTPEALVLNLEFTLIIK